MLERRRGIGLRQRPFHIRAAFAHRNENDGLVSSRQPIADDASVFRQRTKARERNDLDIASKRTQLRANQTSVRACAGVLFVECAGNESDGDAAGVRRRWLCVHLGDELRMARR